MARTSSRFTARGSSTIRIRAGRSSALLTDVANTGAGDGAGAGRRGDLEPEGRALALAALHADLATHQFGQPAADGEAEARAAVLAADRAVHLGESLEEPLQGVGGDARTGVLDFAAQARRGPGDVAEAHVRPRPRAVNFTTTLPIRFPAGSAAAARRHGVDRDAGMAGSRLTPAPGIRPFWCAWPSSSSTTSPASSTGVERPAGPASNWPASSLEKSRMSLTTASSDWPALRMRRAQQLGGGRQAGHLLQQFGEADPAGERRANLVAHVGQELGLRFRGGLGAGPGADQLALQAAGAP